MQFRKEKCNRKMYSAIDVSRYVINYSNDKKYGISNLKLQKILYLIQAYFLIVEKQACFSDAIEAWDFGPVVPAVYHAYKQYGAGNIPRISSYVDFDDQNIWNTRRIPYQKGILSQADRSLMRDVVDMFKDYSASDLVTLTHNQSPWINAYRKHANNEITIESIKQYFNDKNA